jgi:MscS family membrane protein
VPSASALPFHAPHFTTLQTHEEETKLLFLGDWAFALGAVVVALLLVPISESLLRRFGRSRGNAVRKLFEDLAVPLPRLLYPLGLRIFIDAAPLSAKSASWLRTFAFLLFVLFFVETVRRAALWSIDWFTEHQQSRNAEAALQHGFIPLVRNLVTLFVFLSGLITILKYFGYDVMSLVAALGVGSLAVGLASKDTLSNMISGFTLIIDRNLRPGDRISVGGSVGLVQEIGLRSTRMDLRDGNIMIVPNQDLVNSRIINLSMTHHQFNASTKFRIPLAVPFENIKKTVLETIQLVAKAEKSRAPWVQLSSLVDGQQMITVGFGIADPDDQGEALSQFHSALLKRLTAEGVPLLGPPGTIPS